jgi:pimeloyl-ACP methyl ester carboxylesterase
LSDRNVEDLSFDALTSDLETVVETSGLKRFALLGISQGAALAIDYAARYPDRVSHLVLWGGYSRGRNRRGKMEDVEQAEAFKTLMRHGWGKQSSTFLRMFAALYLPEANEDQVGWWTDLQRIATSPENAVRLRENIDDIDVSDSLNRVMAPTLILHSQREEVAPFSEARRMAAHIPNATLVPLDSANHLVQKQEPAWQRAVDEILDFLAR